MDALETMGGVGGLETMAGVGRLETAMGDVVVVLYMYFSAMETGTRQYSFIFAVNL